MIERMKGHIRRLHAAGKAFLVIEHNMAVVMDLCQRVVVLDHGEKIAEGRPAEIRTDSRVIEAYFGV
jgi:ABC-type branched-subunit amino acid transport system ATPase component